MRGEMKPWTITNARAWAERTPRALLPKLYRTASGELAAGDGACLAVKRTRSKIAHLTPFPDEGEQLRLHERQRPLPDRFRAWCAARAKERADDFGAVEIKIGRRIFNARLLNHVLKIAPAGAAIALEKGDAFQPLHVIAPDFWAVVMPMRGDGKIPKRRRFR